VTEGPVTGDTVTGDTVTGDPVTGDGGTPMVKTGHRERAMDDATRTEIEAATFRRLLAHLDARKDVQNIDMMTLTGFCRNCLSRWYGEEAAARGHDMSKDAAREVVYGEPYEEWKAKYQTEASAAQRDAFGEAFKRHVGEG